MKIPDPGKGKPAQDAKTARKKAWAAPKTKAAKDRQRAEICGSPDLPIYDGLPPDWRYSEAET